MLEGLVSGLEQSAQFLRHLPVVFLQKTGAGRTVGVPRVTAFPAGNDVVQIIVVETVFHQKFRPVGLQVQVLLPEAFDLCAQIRIVTDGQAHYAGHMGTQSLVDPFDLRNEGVDLPYAAVVFFLVGGFPCGDVGTGLSQQLAVIFQVESPLSRSSFFMIFSRLSFLDFCSPPVRAGLAFLAAGRSFSRMSFREKIPLSRQDSRMEFI